MAITQIQNFKFQTQNLLYSQERFKTKLQSKN